MDRPRNAEDLLRKVRKIEIKTRALSHQIFAGEYHSAFKGRGMAFSEVREYQFGDDVRNMDWNVTARLRSPYVKVFEEERELTVVLLIDISRSGLFGTAGMDKRDLIAEIAAVLSFSAIINNDKVGALFFSDRVEKFIPPKKGRSHLLHIIREIIEFRPQYDGTDISGALRYLANAIKKRCTAFLLSDMLDVNEDGTPRYEDALKVAVGRHDLSVIEVYDPREREIPDVGLLHVKDSETLKSAWVDTSSKKVRDAYAEWFRTMSRSASTRSERFIGTDVDRFVDKVSISVNNQTELLHLQIFALLKRFSTKRYAMLKTRCPGTRTTVQIYVRGGALVKGFRLFFRILHHTGGGNPLCHNRLHMQKNLLFSDFLSLRDTLYAKIVIFVGANSPRRRVATHSNQREATYG